MNDDKRRLFPRKSSHNPTICTKSADGDLVNPAIKRPRERERENIDICINHCPHPNKPCSGTRVRMEKCREEYEGKLKK